MKGFIIFMLLLTWSFNSQAQISGIQPDDPAFIERYQAFDFKGQIAATIHSDSVNNYYLVDFSLLPERFERVWFMNLTFSVPHLVNIDPDISKSRVCFMSNRKYSEASVLKEFSEIKIKVANSAADWTGEQKSEWLKVNDKYK